MASNTSLILTDDWLKTDLLISLNTPSTSEEMDRLIKMDFIRLASTIITLVSTVNFIGKLLSTTTERPIMQIGMALLI